jgi:hypothetical protein
VRTATKLHIAGRSFLLRLVATHGPTEAARILRQLADELEWLRDDEGDLQGDPMADPQRPYGRLQF